MIYENPEAGKPAITKLESLLHNEAQLSEVYRNKPL